MRPICWLHISDIHMRVSEAWSHDVVLAAMCEAIRRQRREGLSPDFILVTGDLAFSGKADEYRLVADFFDALSEASGVPKDRIFCIPGNHDVDRDRQRMCFQGARQTLVSTSHVDAFLAPGEDLDTLLSRQANYRRFCDTYFHGQQRTPTPDGLGYVAGIVIEDVQFAIVGLNSAWLAEGGFSDHGKLLVGERQAIDGLSLTKTLDPHIVVAMTHHPFHLLQEFDRGPVQRRIEGACQFIHCGHLHEPESRHVGHAGPNCLVVAAGASFETRESHNSYSIVSLDLLRAKRTIKTIQYNPRGGEFSFSATDEYSIEIAPSAICSVREVAGALTAYQPSLSTCAHYLSALLLGAKAEVPIPAASGYTFGSFAVLQTLQDGELKAKTIAFRAFSNLLRVFYGRIAVSELLTRYGEPVSAYGDLLQQMGAPPEFKARLDGQERESQMLAEADPGRGTSHTTAMMTALAGAHDWEQLREQAARHAESTDAKVAIQARRMLALGLAHSSEEQDKAGAVDLYRSLVAGGLADAADVGILATLLVDGGRVAEAKAVLLDGITRFGGSAPGGFHEIGMRIVEATGDREFRGQLQAAMTARGKRD